MKIKICNENGADVIKYNNVYGYIYSGNALVIQ